MTSYVFIPFFVRVSALLLQGGNLIDDLNGFFSDNLTLIVGMAMTAASIVTLAYAGFGLRKYLSGDGRSSQELLKVIVGVLVFFVLLAGASMAFFGRSVSSPKAKVEVKK